jgi:hypothetical protein
VGDAVLLGLSSLFAVSHEEISNSHVRHARTAWDESANGLHRRVLQGLQGWTGTRWEQLKLQKLLIMLSSMTLELNLVAQDMKRETHYDLCCATHADPQTNMWSVCVAVSSTAEDVADNWGASKMLHRLCEIRKLRSSNSAVSEPADLFYDILDHQLIGVG